MISILIPLYNGVKFLEECINSVISQTYNDWECIIGINGHESNSDIEKKARNICSKDSRIIVKFYLTKGKTNTLNKMVEECNYEFIAILDCDDIWFPEKLQKQIVYLNKYDVIGTACQYIGKKNIIPPIPYFDYTNSHDFFCSNPIINSSVIIRKEDAYWNNNSFGLDDYYLWFYLKFIKNRTFYNSPEILVYHRIHNKSFFNSKNIQDIDNFKKYWMTKLSIDK
jgi:teichuronic acid biosynthesis glycosyltransferase TuaG